MIECKPKRLQVTKINILKKEAAEKFCNVNNMIYKFRDIKKHPLNNLTSISPLFVLNIAVKGLFAFAKSASDNLFEQEENITTATINNSIFFIIILPIL